MKRLRIVALLILGVVIVASHALPAAAVSGDEFQPGRIMDDGVFYNSGSMNQAQIQQFLDSKVSCDRNGTEPYAGTTRAAYGTARGNPPPYTCLNGYIENTTTKENNLQGRANPAGGKSAAQIIYEVGQTYAINPQVLIALLQKEQGLVTDEWPWPLQYRSATGFGCPDSAPCDAQYYGFYNQVWRAAAQFRTYANNPNSFNHIAGQNNYVRWSPNASCGGSTVFIHNQATASIYNYTPYRPNQAALANVYGTGDACSAYGNRNFWRFFSDWFGSTIAMPYVSQFYNQSAMPSVNPGELAQASLFYRNMGGMPWYDDVSIGQAPGGTAPVHLATSHAMNRASAFAFEWVAPNRPAVNFAAVYESDGTTLAADQHVVKPGQIGKYLFTIKGPEGLHTGTYQEYFMPILEGTAGTFNDPGTFLNFTLKPKAALGWYSQSDYPQVAPGTAKDAFIAFRNTGSVSLYDDASLAGAPAGNLPLHLATACPLNTNSPFVHPSWANASRPAVTFTNVFESNGTTLAADQHVVKPGQIAKMAFTVKVPEGHAANSYQACFQPVLEGTSGTFPDLGIFLQVIVPTTPAVTYTSAPASISVANGEPATIPITIRNAGNTTLPASSTIGTDASAYKANSWSGDTTILQLGNALAPGASTTINIPVLTPNKTAQTQENFTFSLKDGSTTVPGSTKTVQFNLAASQYTTAFKGQSGYEGMTYGQTKQAYFMYQNTGNKPWYDSTSISSAPQRNGLPVHLAAVSPLNRASGFAASGWANAGRPATSFSAVYEADGTTLAADQHVVQPGQIAKFAFDMSPATWVQSGATYKEYFRPILEGTSNGIITDPGTHTQLTVHKPTYTAQFHSQSGYPVLASGQTASAQFTYRNAGTAPWYDDSSISQAPQGANYAPVHLATSRSLNRISAFASGWPNNSRPNLTFSAVYESDGTTLAADQHVVQPGQLARFSFSVQHATVPTGTYREYFMPIAEGTPNGAFNDPGTFIDVTVQ